MFIIATTTCAFLIERECTVSRDHSLQLVTLKTPSEQQSRSPTLIVYLTNNGRQRRSVLRRSGRGNGKRPGSSCLGYRIDGANLCPTHPDVEPAAGSLRAVVRRYLAGGLRVCESELLLVMLKLILEVFKHSQSRSVYYLF